VSAPTVETTSLGPPIPATGPARRHPDTRTTWIIVMLARLEAPAPPADLLAERLAAQRQAFPLLGARLRRSWWLPGPPPGVTVVPDGEPLAVAPLHRFDLACEAPLRVVAPADGRWLLLCAHHFAFDGLGLVALVRGLLGDRRGGRAGPVPDYTTATDAPRRPLGEALGRLARPARPVAPSPGARHDDTFCSARVETAGPGFTARLAGAAARAVVAHNAAHRTPADRLGLSVAVGGVDGHAATYRRVDVRAAGDASAAVTKALADPAVPAELGGLPPGAFLLRPLLARLSDTLLVSNLGRLHLPGVAALEFFPVARGRSAVALGAAGLAGGSTTLSLRAGHLDHAEASRLLDQVVVELADGSLAGAGPGR